MQLRNKTTEVRSIKFTSLLFETQSTKHSGSQFGGRGRNGKNNWESHSTHCTWTTYLELLEPRATSTAGDPVYTKNVAPSAGFISLLCSGLA